MVEIDFTEKQCVTCGCVYYVPADVLRIHKENKTYFYCYNGHAQCYSKTESEEKQQEIDRLTTANKNRESEIQRLSVLVTDLRRQLTPPKPVKRKAKRIANEN